MTTYSNSIKYFKVYLADKVLTVRASSIDDVFRSYPESYSIEEISREEASDYDRQGNPIQWAFSVSNTIFRLKK